ncbi:MAG: hypothetical protein RLZZ628_1646 [Bacteroidota bacterium]|jgi:hypothetical protein
MEKWIKSTLLICLFCCQNLVAQVTQDSLLKFMDSIYKNPSYAGYCQLKGMEQYFNTLGFWI